MENNIINKIPKGKWEIKTFNNEEFFFIEAGDQYCLCEIDTDFRTIEETRSLAKLLRASKEMYILIETIANSTSSDNYVERCKDMIKSINE